MKILTRFLQLIVILIPLTVFGWLLKQYLVPTGEFFVEHSVGETSPYIDRILPDQRVEEPYEINGGWVQKILDDPAFFFVHPHRSFDLIDVEVVFQSDIALAEFGGLGATNPDRYQLQPLRNKFIDDSDWDRIDDNGLILLQREKKYQNLDGFVSNPPERSQVATYQTEFDSPYRMSGYYPTQNEQVIDVSLRGYHEFKTYIKDEVLSFTFEYMDMNRDEGADPVSITVFDENGNPIAEARARDDGDVTRNAIPSKMNKIDLVVPALPEGVYKVTMNSGRDIFFRKIKTTQQKMVFLNNVFLGDEIAYKEPGDSIDFWTEGKRFSLQTRHAEGVQDVKIGTETLSVEEPYELYTLTTKQNGRIRAHVPKGDVEVIFDSPIAFAPQQYFNPDPASIRFYTDLDAQNINYILARYTPPEELDGWLVKTLTFDTRSILLDEGSWKFVFSLPGIRETDATFLVKNLNLRLKRRPFRLSDLKSIVKKDL